MQQIVSKFIVMNELLNSITGDGVRVVHTIDKPTRDLILLVAGVFALINIVKLFKPKS